MILGYSQKFLPKLAVPAIRTFPSIAWMMPLPHPLWGNLTLLQTPHKNYTTSELKQLMKDIKAPVLESVWDAVRNRVGSSSYADPGVKVFCGYANDTKTALQVSRDVQRLVKAHSIAELAAMDWDGVPESESEDEGV